MVPIKIANPMVRPTMGQDLNAATPAGRSNLTELAMGVAFVGGSAWALTQVSKYRKEPMSQVAMGTLSAGLMIAGLLNVWGGLQS